MLMFQNQRGGVGRGVFVCLPMLLILRKNLKSPELNSQKLGINFIHNFIE